MPIDPPFGDNIAVFTPITFPSVLNKGPPEFPLLIAASV
jgi:hypothetical protein